MVSGLRAVLLVSVLAAMVLAADVAAAGSGRAKWVVMVYMAADNDLEPFSYLDLEELEQVGSSGDVVWVVFVDRAAAPYEERLGELGFDPGVYGDWSGARVYLVERHPGPGVGSRVLVELGEVDTGSPDTLVRFVGFVVERFPADRYMLVLWNHGSGFEVAFDEEARDSLSGRELMGALRKIRGMGVRIDVLGFDACLMASVETFYAVSDYVGYVVASADFEPGYGWPYDRVARALVSDPGMGAEELAKTIVRVYGEYYEEHGYRSATLSAFRLTGVSSEEIEAAVGALAGFGVENPEPLRRARGVVREYGVVEGAGGVTVDFVGLVENTAGAPAEARRLAEKLVEARVANYAGELVAGSSGVTIFYPARVDLLDRYRHFSSLGGGAWLGSGSPCPREYCSRGL